MRRLFFDLVSTSGRRLGNNAKSRTQRSLQRRRHSTESSNNNNNNTIANDLGNTERQKSTPTPSGSAASSAGAAVPPLSTTTATTTTVKTTRSVLDIVRTSPLGRFGAWYSRAQDRRPYVTQVASSFVIYMFGDLSAQLLFPAEAKPSQAEAKGQENEKSSVAGYDPLRTLRHLAIGLSSSIPQYKWFMWLHHNFNYSSRALSIFVKVCVQQSIFAPTFNTYFFSLQSILSGDSLDETWQRLKRALPSSLYNSMKLWPAVTAISFLYVPPQFRSVFGGVIAVGWQTYLSWLNQKAAREIETRELAAELGQIVTQAA